MQNGKVVGMNRKLVIRIKKPSQAEFLLWIILLLPFLFGMLIEFIGLPSAVKYICDIAWLGLLLLLFLQRGTKTWEQKILIGFVVCFLLYTLLGFIVNLQSPLYYLWGVRNNFRVYVVFFAVIAFAKQRGRDGFLGFFDKVFWINAVVCLVQYFLFEKQQDFLGGLFGTEKGCNAYLNNYFVIMAIMELTQYLNGKKSLLDCILKCGTMLVISALAELKFFYAEFVVIVVMAVLLTDFSWKKVLVIVGGFAGVALTTRLLVTLFPLFEGTFSLESMLEVALSDAGYTGSGGVNRLNSIPYISQRFLKTLPEQIIGLGLGNCDTASFSFLNTPFYIKHSAINYTWFSSAFVFLETGYIGLGFFFGFFLLVFFRARKVGKKQPHNKLYCQMAMIGAVCCIMIGIYNSALRSECGYMMYFMLALPFVKEQPPKARFTQLDEGTENQERKL